MARAITQQAITWTNDDKDLYRLMATQGYNELNMKYPVTYCTSTDIFMALELLWI